MGTVLAITAVTSPVGKGGDQALVGVGDHVQYPARAFYGYPTHSRRYVRPSAGQSGPAEDKESHPAPTVVKTARSNPNSLS